MTNSSVHRRSGREAISRSRPTHARDGVASLRVEKGLFYALVLIIVLAPIPLGSNRVWAATLLQIALYSVLAGWLVLWAFNKAKIPAAFRHAWPAHLAFVAWILLLALQVTPLPPAWIEFLSPTVHAYHLQARAFAGVMEGMTLSVDAHASWAVLLRSFGYYTAFSLCLLLVTNRERVRTLAASLVAIAFMLAVYGVLMHLAGTRQVWFGTLILHDASASATFPNRNHFAGWLVMCLALGIGLLLADLKDHRHDSWKEFARSILVMIFSRKIQLRIMLCVLVIALTTTHSRMGNTAFFASLIIVGLIGLALSRHAPRGTVLLLSSLLVIDLMIVGSWFGVEKLAKRIEATTMQEFQGRQDPSDFVFSQINDHPVFGTGAGTFYVVFPVYRGANVVDFFDYAHNDFAQLAAETGWVGFSLLGFLVLASAGAALRAQWLRRDPVMRGISFASLMGILALMIHSWVDFNLQIPANAQLFTVLLALAWISLHLDRRASTSQSAPGEPAAH
jgi:O-antigen ligase